MHQFLPVVSVESLQAVTGRKDKKRMAREWREEGDGEKKVKVESKKAVQRDQSLLFLISYQNVYKQTKPRRCWSRLLTWWA